MDDNGVLKRFSGAIDLKNPAVLRPFEVVEGDTGNVLTLSVTDAGAPVDLTGCSVKAVFSSALGLAVEETGTGVTVDGSEVEIELYPGSFAPGLVECELQIYSPQGQETVLVTTARFNFNCRRALLDGESIEAAPGFPLLYSLTMSVEEAEALRTAAEAARAQAESERAAAESARVSAESGRAASEQARAEAETLRQSAESARASAETARAAAETARASAETARVTAESARQRAETARSEAEAARVLSESARETAFQGMLDSLGPGIETGQGSPPSSIEDAGTVYLDTSARCAYMLVGSGPDWRTLAFEGGWETFESYTLTSACSALEFSGHLFSYKELRLSVIGCLQSSATVSLYVNGSNTAYVRDTAFALTDAPDYSNAATLLHVFVSDVPGFVQTERRSGGVTDNAGLSATKAVHAGFLPITGSAITALKLVCGSNGSFRVGTQVKLEGRRGA